MCQRPRNGDFGFDFAIGLLRKSPFGIGEAVIERPEDTWPKAVVLRLYLKGLERFRASNGKTTLNAVASIQNGKPQVRLWKDRKEDDRPDERDYAWPGVGLQTIR